MKHDELKKAVKDIKMSEDTKNRIIENCNSQIREREEFSMRKHDKNFKRILPIAAVVMLFMITASAVVINHIRGFRDVVKNGAVIDTQFDEVPEMIDIQLEVTDKIAVHVTMLGYESLPYSELDEIESILYHIEDSHGNIPSKGPALSTTPFENGKVSFDIPIDEIDEGEYKLVINGFVGTKKADRPLHICGTWVVPFNK